MRRRQLWAFCALIGAGSIFPLAAQPQTATPTDDNSDKGQSITVTGERQDSAAQRRREAARFVDSHAVRTRIGHLARWHQPICVRVGGLPPEFNSRIAIRVMEIGEGLGIATNRAELCRPNVLIAFTAEPQRLVERAAQRNRLVLGFHYAARRRELMRVRQPVQAWYVTTTRAGSEEVVDEAGVRAPGGSATRLSTGLSSGLAHVTIVADTRVVQGQEVDAIAELLAFLAFAQTPVADACDESATILNLMNPACPPERRPVALTRYDEAYLRALYSVSPGWGPQLQRGTMVLHMTDTTGGDR